MKTNLIPSTIIIIFMVQCITAQEISQWRGPDRDGIYPEKDLLEEWPENGPGLLWKYEDLGLGYSSAAVTDEKIYTSGTIDGISYLFAFSHDGDVLWKKELGPEFIESFPGMRSTPLIYEKYGYILNGLGKLYCFDADDGKVIWTIDYSKDFDAQKTRFGTCENLLVEGDVLYCTPGGKEYNVVTLNRFTGDLIWKSKGNGERNAYCSPIHIIHSGKKYFVTLTEKSVISVDANNGELAWSFPLRGEKSEIRANTPYYKDGLLFVSDGFEFGCTMLKIADDGQGVEKVWENPMMDETNGHWVVIDDNIYGAAETKKKFLCVDWKTGEINYEIRRFSPGTVIAADNHLYCYSYGGLVGLVQPADTAFVQKGFFRIPKKKEIHIVHPVIHDGVIYFRYENTLMAYDIKG